MKHVRRKGVRAGREVCPELRSRVRTVTAVLCPHGEACLLESRNRNDQVHGTTKYLYVASADLAGSSISLRPSSCGQGCWGGNRKRADQG